MAMSGHQRYLVFAQKLLRENDNHTIGGVFKKKKCSFQLNWGSQNKQIVCYISEGIIQFTNKTWYNCEQVVAEEMGLSVEPYNIDPNLYLCHLPSTVWVDWGWVFVFSSPCWRPLYFTTPFKTRCRQYDSSISATRTKNPRPLLHFFLSFFTLLLTKACEMPTQLNFLKLLMWGKVGVGVVRGIEQEGAPT